MLSKEINEYLKKCNLAFQRFLALDEKVYCYFVFAEKNETLSVCFNLPRINNEITYFKNNVLGTLSAIGMKFEKVNITNKKLVLNVSCENMQIFWKHITNLVYTQEKLNKR